MAQKQVLQQKEINKSTLDVQDEIIAERDIEIQKLYQEFKDINELQKTMASLVDDQSTLLELAHLNILTAKHNTQDATENIEEAEKKQETSTGIYAAIATIVTSITIAVTGLTIGLIQ